MIGGTVGGFVGGGTGGDLARPGTSGGSDAPATGGDREMAASGPAPAVVAPVGQAVAAVVAVRNGVRTDGKDQGDATTLPGTERRAQPARRTSRGRRDKAGARTGKGSCGNCQSKAEALAQALTLGNHAGAPRLSHGFRSLRLARSRHTGPDISALVPRSECHQGSSPRLPEALPSMRRAGHVRELVPDRGERAHVASLRFAKEEGGFLGAMTLNYLVAIGLWLVVLVVGMVMTVPDVPVVPLLVASASC